MNETSAATSVLPNHKCSRNSNTILRHLVCCWLTGMPWWLLTKNVFSVFSDVALSCPGIETALYASPALHLLFVDQLVQLITNTFLECSVGQRPISTQPQNISLTFKIEAQCVYRARCRVLNKYGTVIIRLICSRDFMRQGIWNYVTCCLLGK
jgi:hypothetical protein